MTAPEFAAWFFPWLLIGALVVVSLGALAFLTILIWRNLADAWRDSQ